jgi:hypothetical protein
MTLGEPRAIRDLAGAGEAPLERLRTSLAPVRNLGDLMQWAHSAVPRVSIDEIVTQDEYTHDVLVPIQPPLWLAFDVT